MANQVMLQSSRGTARAPVKSAHAAAEKEGCPKRQSGPDQQPSRNVFLHEGYRGGAPEDVALRHRDGYRKDDPEHGSSQLQGVEVGAWQVAGAPPPAPSVSEGACLQPSKRLHSKLSPSPYSPAWLRAPRMRSRRNRRNWMGSGRRPVAPSVWWATSVEIGSRRDLPRGPDPVAGAPTTIVTKPGVVVVQADAHVGAVGIAAIGDRATCQQERVQTDQQGDHSPTCSQVGHFVTSLPCASGHSSSPKGAPSGSATMATLPPCRSRRGSTSTRPPSETTLALNVATSSTWT